jgi:MoaA/NifB/PqqE/SkfB family radical SAM enzyme
LFVSSDGKVSPCVFTNLPISSKYQAGLNARQRYRRLTFGAVAETSIAGIWRKDVYRAFRRFFLKKTVARFMQ